MFYASYIHRPCFFGIKSHLRRCFVSHTLIGVNQNGALDALRVLNDSPIEKAEPYYYKVSSSLCFKFCGSLHSVVYVSPALPFLFSTVCLNTLVTCTNVCIEKLRIPILWRFEREQTPISIHALRTKTKKQRFESCCSLCNVCWWSKWIHSLSGRCH